MYYREAELIPIIYLHRDIYLSITLHEQHSLSLSHLQPLHERLVSLYAEMRTWMVKSQLLGAR